MREFILYKDNSDEWVAECGEIPGYRARGGTKEEAIEKLKAALLVFYPCKCEDEPDHN
jgi:predicted RNase H-like HicB family nuclease